MPQTTDKQSRRKVRKGELVLWKLKPDAVPSVWPGLPNHLTTPPPNPRPTTLATSETRQLNDQAVEERREHDRFAEVLSLSELKDKITGIHDLPTNNIIHGKNQILFAQGCHYFLEAKDSEILGEFRRKKQYFRRINKSRLQNFRRF